MLLFPQEESPSESLNPRQFLLWTPPAGRCVEVGPEHRPVPLPEAPLPVHREDLAEGDPSDNAIGTGVYDYLRQFPDCPHNVMYAEVLREAYPHYVADLGAHAAMLAHKEVDSAYMRRKITCLKILALLEPDNSGLLQQIGIAFYELAVMFSEISQCRQHMLSAMGFLQRALRLHPDDLTGLNYLAQIDYLFGDYPAAARRWGGVRNLLEPGPVRTAIDARLSRLEEMEVPDHPLVDDLEAIGAALEACGKGDFRMGGLILERLEEEGIITAEMPSVEFFYLLGVCRSKNGDHGGAFDALEHALEIDPDYQPAREGREAILDGRSL